MTNSTQECREEFDNKLLALIQRHFPNIPVAGKENDESWSRWLAFARDCATLRRAPETVEAGWLFSPEGYELFEHLETGALRHILSIEDGPHEAWISVLVVPKYRAVHATKHQPVTIGVEPTSAGMSDEEAERKLFEKYMKSQGWHSLARSEVERGYSDDYVQFAWLSWQGRAILATATPPDTALPTNPDLVGNTTYQPPVSAAPVATVQMPKPEFVDISCPNSYVQHAPKKDAPSIFKFIESMAAESVRVEDELEAKLTDLSAQVERMREALENSTALLSEMERTNANEEGAVTEQIEENLAALSATGRGE